eukprot:Plantae.Rhodophyta-Purpureofilum_apyrenoidigerum.ctg12108.p1 GENE.Plantae.Rhodophyta-Purpureofilum_apyrenoidigerum.ctg12108~~Plantae.Rhodophyta-Purpureofilum_apyrenoidigerum.ctg12108.p1  ORF type:complete len:415 (-),score=52.03 Plantae.Rhodophyta-Purpureofilum_apyrenoidigerum.ctg12108:809-2053(-)
MFLQENEIGEDGLRWLMFVEDDSSVFRQQYENMFALAKSVVVTDNTPMDPSLVMNRNILFLANEERNGAVHGWTYGMNLPVVTGFGDVLQERFILKDMGRSMPILFTALKLSCGSYAVGRVVCCPSGLRCEWEIYVNNDFTNLPAVTVIVDENQDCHFCIARHVQCRCTPELQLRALPNYEATFQWLFDQNVFTLWERFVLTIFAKEFGISTMKIRQDGGFESTGEPFCSKYWEVRTKWYLTRGDGTNPAASKARFLPNVVNMPTSTPSTAPSTGGVTQGNEASGSKSGSDSRRKKVAESPVRCNLCNAEFSRKRDLRRHVEGVHEDLRRFKCDECSSAFTQQVHLKNHKKAVHEKRRELPCHLCGRAFCTKYQLERHIRSVHKESNCICTGCQSTFTTESHLSRHIREQHEHS